MKPVIENLKDLNEGDRRGHPEAFYYKKLKSQKRIALQSKYFLSSQFLKSNILI